MTDLVRLGPHAINGLWREILPEDFLSWQWPEEKVATCARCPQVGKKGYHPIFRCCTFIPRIPNFLLGMAQESSPELKEHIGQLIRNGYLTPEGLHHNPSQWLLALENDAEGTYGKSDKLLCPNLDLKSGHCKIYAFRNAACATFFCDNDHGSRGAYFWDSLNDVMGRIEFRLMQWSLRTVGFEFDAYLRAYERLMAGGLSAAVDAKRHTWKPEALKLLWGNWYGREQELLAKTAEAVKTHKHDLRRIVREADRFLPLTKEQAQINKIKASESALAEEDADDWDREPIAEAWQEVRDHYNKLWQLPELGSSLQLGSRVVVESNPLQSEKERYFATCPYRAIKAGRKGQLVWEKYLTALEYDGLMAILSFGPTSDALFTLLEDKGLINPKITLSEWMGLGLLRCG